MQMDSKVELKIEDQNFFECHICHNAYEDLRILPCGHTFCFACVQENCQSCALCHKPWSLPEDSIRTLPHDFIIENFKSSLFSMKKMWL